MTPQLHPNSQPTPAASPSSVPDWSWNVCELADVFPDQDYAHSMRFKPCPPEQFFAATVPHEKLMTERRHWLTTEPDRYTAQLPEGDRLLTETLQLADRWDASTPPGAIPRKSPPSDSASPSTRLLELGMRWEPDFLLLKPFPDGAIRLAAGCVCFPSSWALEDKIGKTMPFIHGPVPGLNDDLGARIDGFLRRIRPGVAWMRANWGLSASPELNQHPKRQLPGLDAASTPDNIWLRLEHQALVGLPETGGILFGIRIALATLNEIRNHPQAASGLARSLRTMPAAVAEYKRLTLARDPILHLLSTPPIFN